MDALTSISQHMQPLAIKEARKAVMPGILRYCWVVYETLPRSSQFDNFREVSRTLLQRIQKCDDLSTLQWEFSRSSNLLASALGKIERIHREGVFPLLERIIEERIPAKEMPNGFAYMIQLARCYGRSNEIMNDKKMLAPEKAQQIRLLIRDGFLTPEWNLDPDINHLVELANQIEEMLKRSVVFEEMCTGLLKKGKFVTATQISQFINDQRQKDLMLQQIAIAFLRSEIEPDLKDVLEIGDKIETVAIKQNLYRAIYIFFDRKNAVNQKEQVLRLMNRIGNPAPLIGFELMRFFGMPH